MHEKLLEEIESCKSVLVSYEQRDISARQVGTQEQSCMMTDDHILHLSTVPLGIEKCQS